MTASYMYILASLHLHASHASSIHCIYNSISLGNSRNHLSLHYALLDSAKDISELLVVHTCTCTVSLKSRHRNVLLSCSKCVMTFNSGLFLSENWVH